MEEANNLITVILKFGLHCEGCVSDAKKYASGLEGVKKVSVDKERNQLTIVGEVAPLQIQHDLSRKINKKVELVYPLPDKSAITTASTANNKIGKRSHEEEKSMDINKDSSVRELKTQKAQTKMAVFKVPLHCDGCADRIIRRISRIIGVHSVRANKKEETVTVIGTFDVISLTETMKKRLKKFLGEQKIEIKKEAEVTEDTSHYSFDTKATKQESSSLPALQLPAVNPVIVRILSIEISGEETRNQNQNQSPISLGDPQSQLDPETGGHSSKTETAHWVFLITGLIIEGVSAVFDQRGYLFTSMLLAFLALLLSAIELVEMARREGVSPPGELFSVVHGFGLTCAVWQCLYSTFQYACALRKIDNPINMTPLPFIFLFCVIISKLIRKLEESNCQTENGDASSPPVAPGRGHEFRWRMEQNDQTLESSEPNTLFRTTRIPEDTAVTPLELTGSHSNRSHCGDASLSPGAHDYGHESGGWSRMKIYL